MKKLFAVLLAATAALTLFGCGNTEKDSTGVILRLSVKRPPIP